MLYLDRGNNEENFKKAVADFNRAIQLKPDFFDAYYKLSLALSSLKDFPGEIEVLNRVIKINPRLPESYYYRGLVYRRLGNNSKAIKDFSQVIKLNSKNFTANTCASYYRGITQQENRNIPAAIQSFTKLINFLKIDVNKSGILSEMYEKRGDLYAELNNAQNAVKDYDRVTQLSPETPGGIDQFCHSSFFPRIAHGLYPGGGCWFTGYQRVLPSVQEAQSRLATVYYKRGIAKKAKRDKAGAIQDLQRALAIFVRFSDKTNEQKVRTDLNSLGK